LGDKNEKNELGGACSTLGESGGVYRVLLGNPKERDNLEDPGVEGRIILRWVFRKWEVGTCTGSIWLRMGTGGGHFGMKNERSGSIKCGEFLV